MKDLNKKRDCNAKENFKQIRTPCGLPEQKPNIDSARDHCINQPNSETDFNSIISNIGHFNSKTLTMPNNAQFAQKWQSFQNTLQQLTLDWIDILQECTKLMECLSNQQKKKLKTPAKIPKYPTKKVN